MALKINYKSLFVGDDENTFVENYSCNLAAKEKEKDGQLFITIKIRNNLSKAQAIGEKIFNTARRCFFDNLKEEPRKRFKNSLKAVNKVLDKLPTNYLSALIGFIVGKDLYLAQTGDTAAYLARHNSIEVISQGLSKKGENRFTNIAKGEVKAGDFVVFSSVSLFQYILRVDLAKVLQAGVLIDSLSELNQLISPKISGRAGIIGMTFEEVPELIKEAVTVTKKLPHKLLAKLLKIKIPKIKIPKIKIPKIEIKIPKFLGNIVDSIKNLLVSARHRKSKWLGIFVVVILIYIFGILWYAKDSALTESSQISAAVIKGQDDKEVAETILDKTDIDKIRRVENPKVFVDFSIRQPNINPLGILALKDKFFVFEHNKLYEIDLDKIEELATFEASDNVVSATDIENQDSLIFTTKTGKLIRYRNGAVTFVKTTDGEFQSGLAIGNWADRIYILDPDKNQIWRYNYLPSSDIFESAKGYKADSDLKDAIDFAIDGFIYVLHKDAAISKFEKGRKQNFSIQNESLTEFGTPSKIYTENGLDRIFVMNSGTSRIFIYAKDLKTGNAVYSGQIVFPTISDLRDLYVDKNTNKLYLLDAQKVYEVEL